MLVQSVLRVGVKTYATKGFTKVQQLLRYGQCRIYSSHAEM
jgi:hypothetical protein